MTTPLQKIKRNTITFVKDNWLNVLIFFLVCEVSKVDFLSFTWQHIMTPKEPTEITVVIESVRMEWKWWMIRIYTFSSFQGRSYTSSFFLLTTRSVTICWMKERSRVSKVLSLCFHTNISGCSWLLCQVKLIIILDHLYRYVLSGL